MQESKYIVFSFNEDDDDEDQIRVREQVGSESARSHSGGIVVDESRVAHRHETDQGDIFYAGRPADKCIFRMERDAKVDIQGVRSSSPRVLCTRVRLS